MSEELTAIQEFLQHEKEKIEDEDSAQSTDSETDQPDEKIEPPSVVEKVTRGAARTVQRLKALFAGEKFDDSETHIADSPAPVEPFTSPESLIQAEQLKSIELTPSDLEFAKDLAENLCINDIDVQDVANLFKNYILHQRQPVVHRDTGQAILPHSYHEFSIKMKQMLQKEIASDETYEDYDQDEINDLIQGELRRRVNAVIDTADNINNHYRNPQTGETSMDPSLGAFIGTEAGRKGFDLLIDELVESYHDFADKIESKTQKIKSALAEIPNDERPSKRKETIFTIDSLLRGTENSIDVNYLVAKDMQRLTDAINTAYPRTLQLDVIEDFGNNPTRYALSVTAERSVFNSNWRLFLKSWREAKRES